MRMFCAAIAAASVGFWLPGAASAKPAGAIDCAVEGLAAKQRAELGTALLDDQRGDIATRAHDIIAKPAAACAGRNRWTDAQAEIAINWSVWDLMGDEVQRRSGLSPADRAIMRLYVAEDPGRVAGLEHFTRAQIGQVMESLRQRGAHLRDAGEEADRQLSVLLMLREMNSEEAHFAGS
ncbi:MAG: hypothetical protein JWP15_2767 [Alphaproteobacteria bacterium]|nr:hypothetical protein [Alphaproteobacteria bacterium]